MAILSKWYLILAALCCCSAGQAQVVLNATEVQQQEIDGTPLQVAVNEDLSMTVSRQEGASLDAQYYTTYQTYLIVTRPGGAISNYSSQDGDFTLISNNIVGNTITTVVGADGGNLQITQVVTYNPGAQQITHTWTVANSPTSGITYPNLSLRYGGATSFHGIDAAIGFLDASYDGSDLVYCVNPTVTGLMGLSAAAATPASDFAEDLYTVIGLDLPNATTATPATLDDSVNPSLVQNATGLEWDFAGVAPGASEPATAYEIWDDPAHLQMTATTAPASAFCATSTTVSTTITNEETGTDSFTIQGIATPGITVSQVAANGAAVTGPVTLAAGQSLPLTVTFSGANGLANTQGYVGLLAVSTTTPSIIQQSGAQLTFLPAIAVTPTPAQEDVYVGPPLAISFQLTNNETGSDTFDLQLQETAGITISGITLPLTPLTLAAGQSQTLTLTATAGAALAGSAGSVALTAISQSNASFNTQGIVAMDVSLAATVTPPVVSGTSGTGVPLTFTFVLDNLESSSDTFDLGVTASTGMSITGVQVVGALSSVGSEATIAADTSVQAIVTAVAASSLAGGSGTIGMIAASEGVPGVTGQATLALSFTSIAAPPPPANTPVPAPVVPISGTQVFYVPISPSTPQGVADVLSVFGGLSAKDAVAYAWDPLAQSYTLLPTQPAGGLLITSGVFIASTVGLPLDFSGTPTQFPLTIDLQPGWNLIGIPPMDPGDGSPVITSHPFPSGFNLLGAGGVLVLSQATFIDTLGTVGSASTATCDPYLFDNPGYTQVGTMQSGIAYWFKNNTSSVVSLQRVLSGVTLSAHHAATAAASSAAAATATYTDRGTPPPPPSSQADAGSGGGSCGAGAAGALLLPLAVLGWRRRRSRR